MDVCLRVILKKLVSQNGMNLRQLSKVTGVPQATLSSYMSGGGSSKPQHIRALARHFNVSMEYLLFGEDSRPSFESILTEHVYDGWLKVKIERTVPSVKLQANKGKNES